MPGLETQVLAVVDLGEIVAQRLVIGTDHQPVHAPGAVEGVEAGGHPRACQAGGDHPRLGGEPGVERLGHRAELRHEARRHARRQRQRHRRLVRGQAEQPRAGGGGADRAQRRGGRASRGCGAAGSRPGRRGRGSASPRCRRRRRPRPTRPSCSASARIAGTSTAVACALAGSKLSSKSSACAAVPLTSAAQGAASDAPKPIAVAGPSPQGRTLSNTIRAAGSAAPGTLTAITSSQGVLRRPARRLGPVVGRLGEPGCEGEDRVGHRGVLAACDTN